MKDKNKKQIPVIMESSAILIASLLITLVMLFNPAILVICAILNLISVCLLIAYIRSFRKKEQSKDMKEEYAYQLPQKREYVAGGPGSGMVRQYISPDDVNGIHLSKNVSMSQGCHEYPANVLVIGGADSGMHEWVKQNLLSGNANYVVANIDHEYDDVYQSLLNRGYTINNIRITDHEAEIPDNILKDIPCKEKQLLSIDVDAQSLSQELVQMRLTYAAACIYGVPILMSCRENQACEQHVQFYIDEAITPRLPNLQTMMRTARPHNIGICLMAEDVNVLWQSRDAGDMDTGLMQTAFACHAILYMGGVDYNALSWTKRIFALESILKENESITDLPYSDLIGLVDGITFRDKKI